MSEKKSYKEAFINCLEEINEIPNPPKELIVLKLKYEAIISELEIEKENLNNEFDKIKSFLKEYSTIYGYCEKNTANVIVSFTEETLTNRIKQQLDIINTNVINTNGARRVLATYLGHLMKLTKLILKDD